MILAGASIAFSKGAAGVVIGLLDESAAIFPDQTSSFVQKAETAIAAALGETISVLTPLITSPKSTVMMLARERGLTDTYSCHSGNAVPCGICVACKEILNSQVE